MTVANFLPVPASHSASRLSPPVARVRSSRENATVHTRELSGPNRRSSLLPAIVQSRNVGSSLPEARVRPSQENATFEAQRVRQMSLRGRNAEARENWGSAVPATHPE